MNLHNVSLTISAVSPRQYPASELPEVAFVGRSNVGKSSCINKLLNRKSLARVSQKPGKTVTINFYNIDNAMHLVDLPGYGYAKLSKEEKKSISSMIETYLHKREQLRQVVLLVDSRHKPTADDCRMMEIVRASCPRAVVVATKCDKLKPSQLNDRLRDIIVTLQLAGEDIIVPFSAVDGRGVEEFWDYAGTVLEIG